MRASHNLGVGGIAVVIVMVAWAGWVHAEAASTGGQMFREARFDEAERWCESVLANPSATVEQLAEAHLYLAALRLMDDDDEAAERHVRSWVALDPDFNVPRGLPLQLEELRDQVLQEMPEGGMSLNVTAPPCLDDGSSVAVAAEVVGAPEGLVGTLVLECGAASNPWRAEQRSGDPVRFEIPEGEGVVGDTLACAVLARTVSGAVLRRQTFEVRSCSRETPLGDESPQIDLDLAQERDADVTESTVGTQRRSPWVWVGVALGSAAVVAAAVSLGVVFGTMPDDAVIGGVELESP